MSYIFIQLVLNVLFFVVLLGAWVTGRLDPYQKRLQEKALDIMGENKVSYGLKSTSYHYIRPLYFDGCTLVDDADDIPPTESLTGKKLTEDKNLNKIQETVGGGVGNLAGGLVGKGGLAEPVGASLSKLL